MTHEEVDGIARALWKTRRATVFAQLVGVLIGAALVTGLGYACTRQQAAQVVSAGSGVAELICAVVLEPDGTEREICDTGAKLAKLLGELLAAGASERASSPAPAAAPSVSGLPSAEPVASARAAARPAATASVDAGPAPAPRVRLLRFYVKQVATDGGSDAAAGTPASEAGAVHSPGMVPG